MTSHLAFRALGPHPGPSGKRVDGVACSPGAGESLFAPTELLLKEIALALEVYTRESAGKQLLETASASVTLIRANEDAYCEYPTEHVALWLTVQGSTKADYEGYGTPSSANVQLVHTGVNTARTLKIAEDKKPFLAVIISLDLHAAWEIATQLGFATRPDGNLRLLEESRIQPSGPLLSCVLRVVRLLPLPEAIRVLQRDLMHELCYWLLSGPGGHHLFALLVRHQQAKKVSEAIQYLHNHFRSAVSVEDLAAEVGMSPASLHRHFKNATTVSPLQYLKKLRLSEARRLMTSGDVNVKSVAYKVGYVSASHFSREFTRMFGQPPCRERQVLTSGARSSLSPGACA